ncbi:MAG: T9SS type A sorting domain-containing protein [Cyclobacteriaceae bacterium]
MRRLVSVFIFCFGLTLATAQSLEHPVIFATSDDRAQVLELIDNYPWAQSLKDQMEKRVAPKLSIHQSSPKSLLKGIAAFAQDDNLSEAAARNGAGSHNSFLSTAAESGLLYYLTGDEKYARLSADIIAHYVAALASREASKTSISGNYFYDPRTTYGHFAIAYDFVYNFLNKPDTKVFELSTETYENFNNTEAQQAIKNIVGNALAESAGADTHGKTISNHPVLTAPGVLFPILCVEDDTERERLFDVFWNVGTKRQNSFKNTILPMFGEQGIWPEALSYSFMPNVSLVLNIVDRLKPELNSVEDNIKVLEGGFLFDYLRNPDRRFVRYGDSKRENDATGTLYRYTLNLAERKGLETIANQAKVALKQAYDLEGGYQPQIPNSIFDNYQSYSQLLWGVPIPESTDDNIDFNKPTVVIKHAGVALQRNYVEEENENYGLCGIIGGAHYVHSHASGLAMELYGSGYVMGANGGLANTLAERQSPEHTGYFWRHAGNNTIIVNGTSHGIQSGAWKSNSDIWMNTTINIAAEPKHLEEPINQNFSFATQFLDDKVNRCEQQRTLSTIRTSPTTGYYFDMFRSRSLAQNNFHDYVYHNLGDYTAITNQAGEELDLTSTDRYQTDIGDTHKSPGWRFFENTQVTQLTDEAINVRFDISYNDRAMHLFIPSGSSREYTKALGPATREAKNGYVKKKTQIIAIRQSGEAWKNPFVAIFEPTIGKESSVKSVEHLYSGDTIVGAKVISEIEGGKVIDYIICTEGASNEFRLPEIELYFKGHFAIARFQTINDITDTVLYVGAGSSLSFYEQEKDSSNLALGWESSLKSDAIKIFPIPTSGMLNIQLDQHCEATFRLYSLAGDLVRDGLFLSETVLDVSSLKGGIYLLEVVVGDVRRFQKVILSD